MPRTTNINEAEIERVVAKIESEGRTPTVANVRNELGSGSNSTITKILRTVLNKRHKDNSKEVEEEFSQDEIKKIKELFAIRDHKKSAQVEDLKTKLDEKQADIDNYLKELENKDADLELAQREVETGNKMLAHLKEELAVTQDRLKRTREEVKKLQQDIRDKDADIKKSHQDMVDILKGLNKGDDKGKKPSKNKKG